MAPALQNHLEEFWVLGGQENLSLQPGVDRRGGLGLAVGARLVVADVQFDQGLAAALMSLAWAAGQIVGSGAGGAVAKAAGDALPMTMAAALCLGTLVAYSRLSPPGSLSRRS